MPIERGQLLASGPSPIASPCRRKLPVVSFFPSGENARASTAVSCPSRVTSSCLVMVSQTFQSGRSWRLPSICHQANTQRW
jgi:hypothetical protein